MEHCSWYIILFFDKFSILALLLVGELSTLTLSFSSPTIIPITLFTLLRSKSGFSLIADFVKLIWYSLPHKMTLRQWWNALFLNIQYIWCCNEGLYISMPRVPTSARSINESMMGSCRYTPSRSIKQEFGLIFHILLLRT